MRNKLRKATALAVLGLVALASSAPAQPVSITNVKVLRVRAYADGNMHIDFSKSIGDACGRRLRVPGGPGQDNVLKVALAAMMSGRLVTVESGGTRSGQYCNLVYIWLQNQ